MGAAEQTGRPAVPVFLGRDGRQDLAVWVLHGLEEEGVPGIIRTPGNAREEDILEAARAGLGVSVRVDGCGILIYARLRKDEQPFAGYPFRSGVLPADAAKRAGQDAARMIKGKPLVGLEQDGI